MKQLLLLGFFLICITLISESVVGQSALRVQTSYGYVDVGPKNTGWCHFYTDRSKYYFNKEVRVNSGKIGSYDDDLQLTIGGTTKMTIYKNTGHIGWGGNGYLLKDQGASIRLGGSGKPYLDFVNHSSATSWYDMRFVLINDNTLVLRGNSNNPGTERFIVEGKIGAQEVRVSTDGWADYVFNESYELMPIDEVEKYIEKNGHLPNVPSEDTVVSEGLDLGEMMTIQQEKIEELYLYLIDLKKENDDLKKAVEDLQK